MSKLKVVAVAVDLALVDRAVVLVAQVDLAEPVVADVAVKVALVVLADLLVVVVASAAVRVALLANVLLALNLQPAKLAKRRVPSPLNPKVLPLPLLQPLQLKALLLLKPLQRQQASPHRSKRSWKAHGLAPSVVA